MSASIYIETIDARTTNPVDLVMIHGWAMHSGLMKGLAEKLSDKFRTHLVDLPGHGCSQLNGTPFDLIALATEIYKATENIVPGKAIWLGWSLGGLVATKIAELYPQNIEKLILMSSTPAFVKHHDWPHAVDKQVFENFADDLESDIKTTITRFLSLQVRGTDNSRQTLKKLREIVFDKDVASKEVLQQGLNVLEQTDLRTLLDDLQVPLLLLGGERDTLVPQLALQELAKKNNIQTSIIEKAGHAPFLSHPDQCAEVITRFCHV